MTSSVRSPKVHNLIHEDRIDVKGFMEIRPDSTTRAQFYFLYKQKSYAVKQKEAHGALLLVLKHNPFTSRRNGGATYFSAPLLYLYQYPTSTTSLG